jgi:hypothetical protein
MAGFADDASGFDVMYADNVDFSGSLNPQSSVLSNGQLLIGSTALPHIRVGSLTSMNGSIAITNGSGTIDLSGAAQGFQPNAVIQLFDDFFPNALTAAGIGASQLAWFGLAGGGAIPSTDPNHPGIWQVPSGAQNEGLILKDSSNDI